MDKKNKNAFFDFFKQKVESELKKSLEGIEEFEDLGRSITNLMKRKKKDWQDYQAENNPPGKNEKSDKTAKDTIIIEVKDGSSTDTPSETENKEAMKEPVSTPKPAKKAANKKAKATIKVAVKNAKKSFKEKAKKASEEKNKGGVNSAEIEKLNQAFQMELDLQDGRYQITLEQLAKANKLAVKAMKKAHKKRIKALRKSL